MHPIRPTLAAALAAGLLAAFPAAAQPPAPMPPPEPAAPPEAPAPPPAAAPQPFVFEQYQLVLLKRPADAPEYPPERLQEIQRGHLAHMNAMAEAGHLVIAGPFSDQEDERLRGLALYQVGSVDEARRLAAADPAVQAGRLAVEVLTWNVEKGYMVFPKRPPVASEEEEAAAPAGEAAPDGGR